MKKKILFILLIGVVSLISIQCSKEKKEKKQAEAPKSDKGLISNIKDGFEERKQAKNQKFYEVKTQFAYSDDAGKTYGNTRKEFKVGETVYMRLIIEIKEKKEEAGIIAYIGGGAASGAAAGAGVGTAAGAAAAVVGAIPGAAIGGAIGGAVGGVAGGVAYFSSKSSLDFIDGEIIIPNITSVDARYYDGNRITPRTDEISGAIIYPINIRTSLEEDELKEQQYWIVQFIPNKESEISIELKFDDNIAEQYDRMNTIKFVK